MWEHNWFGEDRYRVRSEQPIPAGHHALSADIRVDSRTLGTGGTTALRLKAAVIGTGRFDKQVPFRFTVNETFDIGCSTITPVSDLYESPATYNGTIKQAIIDISGEPFEDLELKPRLAIAIQ